MLAMLCSKPLATNIATGRTADHRFIHQATTGIAHPYGETNHQVSEDTQAHGLHKSMVQFVVSGLQDVLAPTAVGSHIFA